MKREWKPGDVAMRRGPNGAEKFAVCVTGCTSHVGVGAHWHTVSESGRADWDTFAFDGVTYRPLVVIDPEDREQVKRALAAWFGASPKSVTADEVTRAQKAYRSLVAEPKPPEPTGLGAVVEDDMGRIYTRYEKAGPKHEPQPWWQSANGPEHDVVRRFSWSDIDAVRVLSEGVTP